jgi:hypothetical protein
LHEEETIRNILASYSLCCDRVLEQLTKTHDGLHANQQEMEPIKEVVEQLSTFLKKTKVGEKRKSAIE